MEIVQSNEEAIKKKFRKERKYNKKQEKCIKRKKYKSKIEFYYCLYEIIIGDLHYSFENILYLNFSNFSRYFP